MDYVNSISSTLSSAVDVGSVNKDDFKLELVALKTVDMVNPISIIESRFGSNAVVSAIPDIVKDVASMWVRYKVVMWGVNQVSSRVF